MGFQSVKWVSSVPPRVGGTGGMTQLARIAKKLHENPNKWAQVGSSKNSTEIRTMSGRLRGAGLQVSVRRAAGGWTKVFARYNSSSAKKAKSAKKR